MIFIGIDFGSCALKAVAIKTSGKTFHILQTHYFPIKPEDSEEQKELSTLSHLKDLIDLYKNRDVKYIFCCPQNEISVHTLHFPFKERYKIKKSLPFEIEDKLALFSKQNLISDIKIISRSENSAAVLVFSSFKENIVKLIETLSKMGIQPFIVSCEASAVSNLFEKRPDKKQKKLQKPEQPTDKSKHKECELYVKIGHTHTMVMVFSQGLMENVYSFEWGVSSCIRKIARKYEIPFHAAQEQFCEKAFVLSESKGYTGSQIEFSKAIQEPLGILVHKLQLLLLELQGEKKYKCKRLFITGGGSQIRNLQVFLSKELKLPCVRVEHPTVYPEWNLRNNEEHQNNLITALGTALEGMKNIRNPAINFLKGDLAVKMNPLAALPPRWKQNALLIITALVFLNLYSLLRQQQSETLSNKIQNTFRRESIRTAKLSPKNVSVEKVKTFMKNQKKILKHSELSRELKQLPSALDRIKNLSTAIKKSEKWNMDITQLNIIDDKIQIAGLISPLYLKDLENQLQELAETNTFKNLSTSAIKTPSEKIQKNKKEKTADITQKTEENIAPNETTPKEQPLASETALNETTPKEQPLASETALNETTPKEQPLASETALNETTPKEHPPSPETEPMKKISENKENVTDKVSFKYSFIQKKVKI